MTGPQLKTIIIRTNMTHCPNCGVIGTFTPVEILPSGDWIVSVVHENSKAHKWVRFNSLNDIGPYVKKHKREAKIMNCPKCHKRGRVSHYFTTKDKPETIAYYIEHEIIGKSPKGAIKRRRCNFPIKDKELRDIILKRLGRYIPPIA